MTDKIDMTTGAALGGAGAGAGAVGERAVAAPTERELIEAKCQVAEMVLLWVDDEIDDTALCNAGWMLSELMKRALQEHTP